MYARAENLNSSADMNYIEASGPACGQAYIHGSFEYVGSYRR